MSTQQKSEFHKYIERVVGSEFDFKLDNKKSIVVSAKDENHNVYVFSSGETEDVVLALCGLFDALSEFDREYFCRYFTAYLDFEKARYIYDTIKERDDFDTIINSIT